jgi:hypothetical protein
MGAVGLPGLDGFPGIRGDVGFAGQIGEPGIQLYGQKGKIINSHIKLTEI